MSATQFATVQWLGLKKGRGDVKMIAISGVPRSGTSVCTNILLKMLGEDRIIGTDRGNACCNPPSIVVCCS